MEPHKYIWQWRYRVPNSSDYSHYEKLMAAAGNRYFTPGTLSNGYVTDGPATSGFVTEFIPVNPYLWSTRAIYPMTAWTNTNTGSTGFSTKIADVISFFDADKNYIYSDVSANTGDGSFRIPAGVRYIRLHLALSQDYFLRRTVRFQLQLDYDYQGVIRPYWKTFDYEPQYNELQFKYERKANQFFHTKELEGNMYFVKDKYEFIKSLPSNTEFELVLHTPEEIYTTLYTGKFRKCDCELDESLRRYKINVVAKDEYSSFIDSYEDKQDLIKLAPAISSINYYKRCATQLYILGSDKVTTLIGGGSFEQDVLEATEDINELSRCHFTELQVIQEFDIEQIPGRTFPATAVGSYYISESTSNTETTTKYYMMNDANTYLELTDLESAPGVRNIGIYQNGSKIFGGMANNTVKSQYNNKPYLTLDSSILIVAFPSTQQVASVTNFINKNIYARTIINVPTVGSYSVYDIPAEDLVENNLNYRYCTLLIPVEIQVSFKKSKLPTQFGKDDNNQYYLPVELPAVAGYDSEPQPVDKNRWVSFSIWAYPTADYEAIDDLTKQLVTLKDAYALSDVIKALLKTIPGNITFEPTEEYSEFLYSGIQQISSLYFNDGYWPYNLVPPDLFITPITNITNSTYDTAAQKAEITLKQVLDMLQSLYRCYWFLDNGKLRIEHVSWFIKRQGSVTVDLATRKDILSRQSIIFGQKAYRFDTSNINTARSLSWNQPVTNPFNGLTIENIEPMTDKVITEEVNSGNFSVDIDYMLLNPSAFSKDSFVLLGCYNDQVNLDTIELFSSYTPWYTKSTYILQNARLVGAVLAGFNFYDMPYKALLLKNTGSACLADSPLSDQTCLPIIGIDVNDQVPELIYNTADDLKCKIGNIIANIDSAEVNIDTGKASLKLKIRADQMINY